MNRQDAISAGDAPWDLQDAILTERPELRRRGPYTKRFIDLSSAHAKNKIEGIVLAASRYQYLYVDSVVTVSVKEGTVLDPGDETYIYVTPRGGTPVLAKTITGIASYAAICGAWTDPDADGSSKQDTRPDAFLVTTDIGAWVVSYDGVVSNTDADLTVVARKTTAGGALPGGGFRACASVNGYTFLGGRVEGGTGAKEKKAAGRRIWWSKLQNSEVWADKTNANYPARGGSETLPITQSIRAMRELDGNLVIFTRGQIHVLQISADVNDWSRQQRASVGTVYPNSIVEYENSLIFANKEGVYRFNGYETVSLTEDAIGQFYRSKFYQQVTAADDNENPPEQVVVGFLYGDYYVLSFNSVTGEALCCHLPTGSWSRFSNLPLLAACDGPAEDQRVFGFLAPYDPLGLGLVEQESGIVRLDRMFVPDASGQDSVTASEGVKGPTLQVELRRTSPDGMQSRKLWRSISVLYDAKNNSGTSSLNLSFTTSSDKDDAAYQSLATLSPTSSMSPSRHTLATVTPTLGIKLTESGDLGKTAISSIELGFKDLRQGRV